MFCNSLLDCQTLCFYRVLLLFLRFFFVKPLFTRCPSLKAFQAAPLRVIDGPANTSEPSAICVWACDANTYERPHKHKNTNAHKHAHTDTNTHTYKHTHTGSQSSKLEASRFAEVAPLLSIITTCLSALPL